MKAYVIKNHLDLAFEEVLIGLVHYSWFHLLSTSTNKSYSQPNIPLKCQVPLPMSRCHFMRYQDQTLMC